MLVEHRERILDLRLELDEANIPYHLVESTNAAYVLMEQGAFDRAVVNELVNAGPRSFNREEHRIGGQSMQDLTDLGAEVLHLNYGYERMVDLHFPGSYTLRVDIPLVGDDFKTVFDFIKGDYK